MKVKKTCSRWIWLFPPLPNTFGGIFGFAKSTNGYKDKRHNDFDSEHTTYGGASFV